MCSWFPCVLSAIRENLESAEAELEFTSDLYVTTDSDFALNDFVHVLFARSDHRS